MKWLKFKTINHTDVFIDPKHIVGMFDGTSSITSTVLLVMGHQIPVKGSLDEVQGQIEMWWACEPDSAGVRK